MSADDRQQRVTDEVGTRVRIGIEAAGRNPSAPAALGTDAVSAEPRSTRSRWRRGRRPPRSRRKRRLISMGVRSPLAHRCRTAAGRTSVPGRVSSRSAAGSGIGALAWSRRTLRHRPRRGTGVGRCRCCRTICGQSHLLAELTQRSSGTVGHEASARLRVAPSAVDWPCAPVGSSAAALQDVCVPRPAGCRSSPGMAWMSGLVVAIEHEAVRHRGRLPPVTSRIGRKSSAVDPATPGHVLAGETDEPGIAVAGARARLAGATACSRAWRGGPCLP